MARTVINQEMIEKINELYLEIGTYAGVSRAMGGTPSPTTIKKYIIVGYKSKAEAEKNRKIFTEERLNELDNITDDFWDIFCVEDWGNLCVLSNEEDKEIVNLWDEMTM